MSVMGLYQDDYILRGSFPFVVPKFVIFVMYYELIDTISGDINFKVHLPGDEPEKPSFDLPFIRKNFPKPDPSKLRVFEDDPEPEAIFHVRIPIVLSPVIFRQEGRVKVRAHYADGTILRLGGLHIKSISPAEPLAPSGGS